MPDPDMSEKDTTRDKLIEILKSEYDRQFEVGRHIDNKASNMLATAGTVTGLLFGFGTFLVSNIELHYQFLSYAFFLLILAIIFNISSVLLSILAFKMTRYMHVIDFDFFLKKTGYTEKVMEEGRNYNIQRIDNFLKKEPSQLISDFIFTYITCNRKNLEVNNKKGLRVLLAQLIFIVSLIIIPFLVGIVLHAYTSNAIRFD